jgi:hypothetical protein
VLETDKIAMQKKSDDLLKDPSVIEAYLGGKILIHFGTSVGVSRHQCFIKKRSIIRQISGQKTFDF